MGNPHALGGRAGIMNVLPGAAGPLFLDRRAMVIELKRDPDHVIARFLQQGCGHGGIDAARHGHDNAGTHGQANRLARGLDCARGAKPLKGLMDHDHTCYPILRPI